MTTKKAPATGRRLAAVVALLLIGAGLLAVAQGTRLFWGQAPQATATPTPTLAERLIPTATAVVPPTEIETVKATADVTPYTPLPASPAITPTSLMSTPTAQATPTLAPATAMPTPPPVTTTMPLTVTRSAPGPTPPPASQMFSLRQRIGFAAPWSDVDRYDVMRLGAGWYLQSQTVREPLRPGGMEVALFVGVRGGSLSPGAAALQDIARHNPGTLWLVGNEPDVIWQGNATPQEYARVYHDAYHLLKEADPTCQVAIGAIAQVTPLRLRYLEAVLAAYQDAYGQLMPVDVWNIHLAILREERGSWGVDIPPGLPDDTGILYEIGDNADIEIPKQQVITFRRWMAQHGWRDKPLIVTEFSVLMPPDYGFPLAVVRGFMTDAFDFLLSARDSSTGLSADGNRLVQRWAWYSLADTLYSTGNLFDPATGQITPLGEAFARYVAEHVSKPQ
jgi:hypothetical protein